jgi:hypothetical protein
LIKLLNFTLFKCKELLEFFITLSFLNEQFFLLLKKFIPKCYLLHKPFDHSIRIFAKFTRKRIIIITRNIIIITREGIFITGDILRRGKSNGFYLLFAFLGHETCVLGEVEKK